MTLAFLFIECVKNQADNVKKFVKEIHGVSEAHSTSNAAQYDVVAKVETEDENRLKYVVNTVKGIAGILAVVTAITHGNVS